MVTIESLPKETIEIFYKSLAKIAPIRVLIKISKPKLLPLGLPNNWRTFKWASQIKVLSKIHQNLYKFLQITFRSYNIICVSNFFLPSVEHKNIKAFITHGGLMGGQEAIHYGVPSIGIPLFVDQFINVDLYVSKKIAIKLDIYDITEEKLDAALNQILYNSEYK